MRPTLSAGQIILACAVAVAVSLAIAGVERRERVSDWLGWRPDLSEEEVARLRQLLDSATLQEGYVIRLEECRLVTSKHLPEVCSTYGDTAWHSRERSIDLRTVDPRKIEARSAWRQLMPRISLPYRRQYAAEHERRFDASQRAITEARRTLGWGHAASLASAEELMARYGRDARVNAEVFTHCDGGESINISPRTDAVIFIDSDNNSELRDLLNRYTKRFCSPNQ